VRRVFILVGLLLLIVAGGGLLWVRLENGPLAPAPAATPSLSATPAAPPSAAPRPSPRPRSTGPDAAPGEPFVVELMDPPAVRYGAPDKKPEGDAYAALVAKLGRSSLTYDAALGCAAREMALQQSFLNGLVPSDIVEFILRSCGAVDRAVEQGYVTMSEDGDAALARQIEKLLEKSEGTGPVRVGIGEVWLVGSPARRVAGVLLSRRGVEIDPAPRRVEPGETWTLTGTLPRGHTDPNALVMRGDGTLEEQPLKINGDRFRLDVVMGPGAGTWEVSVGANGPFGHTPLVQLPVEVGRPPPQTYSTNLPPDESGVKTASGAEDLALRLLNADRVRSGLQALASDPALAAIARAHSEDMLGGHFFGHTSPRTGGPGDRLKAGRYRFAAYAENVALHGSIHEAEAALFHSLGHRKNILHPRMTRVGVGIAMKESGMRKQWYLTQLFADPVREIDPAASAAALLARMNARRGELGLAPFSPDARLDRIAQGQAAAAAAGDLEGLTRKALDAASSEGLAAGGSRAWAGQASDLADMKPTPALVEGAYARVGIGVAQRGEDGAVGVVILVAAP
jgi:uncharacterized protein YkwD